MGKRYYCEFCDKSFADNPTNRKNHLNGVTHHRLRKQHYDAFKDASSILAEEAAKKPCKHFLIGQCDFGDSCRFSHMTEEKRRQLLQEGTNATLAAEATKAPCRTFIQTGQCQYGDRCWFSHLTDDERKKLLLQANEAKSSASKKKALLAIKPPKLQDWLAKREKRLKLEKSADPLTVETVEEDIPEYTLPPSLLGIPNLPPSLIPPTREELRTAPTEGWG